MTTIFILTAAVWFAGFLWYSYSRFGITHSVSALFDEYEKKDKEWIFQVGIIGFALFVALAAAFSDLVAYEVATISIAATFISCSAIAGDTEEHKLIMRNHVLYAHAGIILAYVFILFMTPFWYLGVAGGVATLYILAADRIDNKTYWIEIVTAVLFLLTFYLKII